MYRHELKYIINCNATQVIRSRLNKICSYDRNADIDGKYRVSSLYFDDFCDSAFKHNLFGQYARKKFRIRIYNGNDSFIRLERKSKKDYGCKKDSAVLTKEEYDMILKYDYSFMRDKRNPVLLDFYLTAKTRLLKPKVIVDYYREAFVYGPGTVRITMDKYVKSSIGNVDLFNQEASYKKAMNNCSTILEVKYTGFLPKHIKELIQLDDGSRQAVSKYTMCRMIAS